MGGVRAVPRLCELYPGIYLATEEKARKNLSQGGRRVPVSTMKTEYTEQNIRFIFIYNYNSKIPFTLRTLPTIFISPILMNFMTYVNE
jgi:hypothetical protein